MESEGVKKLVVKEILKVNLYGEQMKEAIDEDEIEKLNSFKWALELFVKGKAVINECNIKLNDLGKKRVEDEERKIREEERKEVREYEESMRKKFEKDRAAWILQQKIMIESKEKDMEIERKAKQNSANLPTLSIAPSQGTIQRIGALQLLKGEYGQEKTVLAAHTREIIELQAVKGIKYFRIKEFYDILRINYEALKAMGGHIQVEGLVLSTLSKLPEIKADITRNDNDWEKWASEDLLRELRNWLKRNEIDDEFIVKRRDDKRGDFSRQRESFMTTEQRGPRCFYCPSKHWLDKGNIVIGKRERKQILKRKGLCFKCGESPCQRLHQKRLFYMPRKPSFKLTRRKSSEGRGKPKCLHSK
eukprot:gene12568-3267_t